MANLFQRLLTPEFDYDAERLNEAAIVPMELTGVVSRDDEVHKLRYQNEYLEESMTDLMRFLEDLNWIPITGWEEDRGFTIESIRENSDRIRALLTVNPTIKKAIQTRVGYIWGRGVTFEGVGIKKMLDNKRNQTILFDDAAHWPLESQLATDGNIWMGKNKRTEEVFNIPISQIAGWVLDPNDPTRVIYWLRSYTKTKKNFSTGVETNELVKVFYPAHDYTDGIVSSIDDIPVDRNVNVVHIAANRQSEWILGVPDIMASMFWAKAHKELFESGTTYVKAQGKFASKVVSKTKAGATNSAARIAETPRRDPNSGEVLDIGGTAVMSGGMDMQLMGKMSGGVDFDKFDPVAGLIAVGLGIPLDVILGQAKLEEVSLEQSTVDEMKMRQKLWTQFFVALFGRKVTVIWPKIKQEPTYRQIQSLEITNKTGALSREEIRQLTLEAYGIEGKPSDLPDLEDNWAFMIAKATADVAAKHAEDAAAAAATVPEQGVDAGVGKLSTGGDAKASRDNKSDRNTKNS